MKRSGKAKRIMAGLLSGLLIASMVPVINQPIKAEAKAGASKTVAGLCTDVISSPKAATMNSRWTGGFVWYGKYDSEPLKYRVLSPKTTTYGESSIFLDCDTVLYEAAFDADGSLNSGATKLNDWKNSDLYKGLNGSSFLTKTDGFKDVERNAIASSTVSGHTLVTGTGAGQVAEFTKNAYGKYIPLTGEKIFILDAEDASNCGYGYYYNYGKVNSRGKAKNNYLQEWWIRSADTGYDNYAGVVTKDGTGAGMFGGRKVTNKAYVSPAFNVKRSSVLFTSVVSGTAGADKAEYKLTLLDENYLTMSIPSGGKIMGGDGIDYRNITVPFSYSGRDSMYCNRFSVLITDKKWSAGNTNNAKILHYGDLDCSTLSGEGVGTFTLPNNLDYLGWGKDFHVYIIAEVVNGEHETDYASTPLEISRPTHTHYSITYKADQDPTCTEKGNIAVHICSCGIWFKDSACKNEITDHDSIYIPATGHKWGEWEITVNPTPKTKGEKERTCSKCGSKQIKAIPVSQAVVLPITLKSTAKGIKISWKSIETGALYSVSRKDEDGDWRYLSYVGDALTFTDTDVVPGNKYTYTVMAQNMDGIELTKYGNGTSHLHILPALKVNVKYKETGAQLTWKAATGAAKYRVFRKTEGGDWTKITTTTELKFIDTTVVYGKNYTYAVRAMNAKSSFISEMGEGTDYIYAAPAPALSAENDFDGIVLNWKTLKGAAKYRVFYLDSSSTWTKLATVKEGTTYTYTKGKEGKSYTFAVVGLDSAGRTMCGVENAVTIERQMPAMDFELKSVAAGVKITWKAFDGAGKYRVYKLNANNGWSPLGTVKATETLLFRDKDVISGSKYTYAVIAMTGGGTALTGFGEGKTIKYVKPASADEIVEAEVVDADGNTIVRIVSEDEISEDFVEVITEETEEKSEDPEEIAEDTDEEISEDAEEVVSEEPEEMISEVNEEESVEIAAEETETDSEETGEEADEENAEETVETVNLEITEEVQE